ncbi:MAG: shikimate kinase [Negativicutes bacterium]|nr:shikimate kinase [Negativicutes bacterium]
MEKDKAGSVFPYNIVLIGFMGSGKSTVGRYLSEAAGLAYYNVDQIIEQYTGKKIRDIFLEEGEPYFRACEEAIIAGLAYARRAVIDCGGGVVLRNTNVACLKQSGKLVWLTAEAGTVYERLKDNTDRPLLRGKDITGIQKLLSERMALYREAADLQVATDGRDIPVIVQDIVKQLSIAR